MTLSQAKTPAAAPAVRRGDPRELGAHPELERLFLPLGPGEQEEVARRMAAGEPFPPLLVDARGWVLAGEENWLGALALGWDLISLIEAPALSPARLRALMVAENIRFREVRPEHLSRGMNNFFDMEPLRPAGGW